VSKVTFQQSFPCLACGRRAPFAEVHLSLTADEQGVLEVAYILEQDCDHTSAGEALLEDTERLQDAVNEYRLEQLKVLA